MFGALLTVGADRSRTIVQWLSREREVPAAARNHGRTIRRSRTVVNRRMRFLKRPGTAGDVHVIPCSPLKIKRILCPCAGENLDAFFKARLSGIAIESVLEIVARNAAPQTNVETAAGENIQDRAFLGEPHRVMQRQYVDEIAETKPLCPARKRGD